MTPAPAEVPAPPAVPAPVAVAVPDVPPAPVAVDTAEVPSAPPRRRLWLATGAVAAVAASLVAGFLLGNGGTTSSGQASDAKPRTDVASPSAAPEANTLQDGADAYTGDGATATDGTDDSVVHADSSINPGNRLFPTYAASDCVLPDRPDSTGRYFSYEPENAIDKLDDTAWRCGRRTGRLSLELGGATRLTNVGLVPGYTKTDPDGTDWFYKNLTVTKAQWTFSLNGQVVAQYTEVIDEPDEAMEWIDLPSIVTADSATVDIVETGNPDARDKYIAISGIGLADDSNF
ncbi:hypothetical protein [Streptomyces sp. NPDC002265]|uniref:hypothetical protein n=1 Tax=Streptomyces sp. NPDC002265 TaxID=3154415 RepID=UPI0033261A1C